MSLKLRNIIAMEDGEYEDIAPETAEAAVDEVEAIEAADEMTSETEVLDEYSEELDETVQDVEELESTGDNLETALENPDYEGLDEVSAEMINIRLRRLEQRRGFDTGYLSHEISKESFNTRTSGRRRKTEIALEGIKDTLIKMWERIKSAVKAIWQAIKDFWKKHVSTMGRLLKALEKTKRRARDVNGSPSGEAPKAPSGLQKAFWVGSSTSITAKHIAEYGTRQEIALRAGETFLNVTAEKLSTFVIEKDGTVNLNKDEFFDSVFGNNDVAAMESNIDKDHPMVNGWFGVIDEDAAKDKKIEFSWDQREVKPSDKRTVAVASKKDMENACEQAIKLIKFTQRFGDNFNKAQSKFDKAMNKVTTAISNIDSDGVTGNVKEQVETVHGSTSMDVNVTKDKGDLRDAMKMVNDAARLLPKINSKITGLNITYGKQVISFCNTCMGNYKEH